MIENGDRIAIGVSGGKDSMLLLYAMWLYKQYMKVDYEIIGITVDLGFGNFDTEPLRRFIEGWVSDISWKRRRSARWFSTYERRKTPARSALKCEKALL